MRPLAVYVHIPFCTIKCGYCDFNAYAGMDALKPQYLEALLAEIDGYAVLLDECEITSIAFGGGTPGEVPAANIAAIVERLGSLASAVAAHAEIGLEANPGTLTGPQLAELAAAGINRVSLGAQSFDAHELAFLDRIHSPEAIRGAVGLARRAGIEQVGLDLIYGIPGQSMESWRRSLRAALALAPDHVSTYALTIEEGTPLALRVAAGKVVPVDDDTVADRYEEATRVLAAAGFEQYELSSWARPGCESRHNMAYWQDREYLGLGAGAHGYLDGERYENIAHPRAYIATLLNDTEGVRRPVADAYRPSLETAVGDWVTLRLRLLAGFAEEQFQARFGLPIDEVLGPPLAEPVAAGALLREGSHLRVSAAGRLLHGEIAVRLVAYLDQHPLPRNAPTPLLDSV
jgi:oxygen-independent coproporphyrinogen-3 oxidase